MKIFGEKIKLNAEVKKLNTFSAHADYNEILDYISQLDTTTLIAVAKSMFRKKHNVVKPDMQNNGTD